MQKRLVSNFLAILMSALSGRKFRHDEEMQRYED